MSDMIGRKLGQYEITGLLGEGGMASVYRARQESMGRDVAIKVIESKLARQLESKKRFQREAKVIASLNHAHILKVVDFGEIDDVLYLVMELQTGGTLAERIQQGDLHHSDIIRVVDQVASALDYAHEQGVIHRDLKPQNILLDSSGNAVIADFGLVKLRTNDSTSFTQNGHALGTPKYMAPEQWESKKLDGRADIYALGAIAYEMLTGRVPFDAETPMQLLNSHLNDSPQPLQNFAPTLSASVNLVVQKALAKKPEQRFRNARLFANTLREALSSPTPSTPSDKSVLSPLSAVLPSNWSLKKGTDTGRTSPRTFFLLAIILGLGIALSSLLASSSSNLASQQPTSSPSPQPTPSPTTGPWTQVERNFDGVQMVLVPAGCFLMGSTEEQIEEAIQLCEHDRGAGKCQRVAFEDELPAHEVCITEAFWIDKTEVTQTQFRAKDGQAVYDSSHWGDFRPVDMIAWNEASRFCGERGARLPTEAEWEYAARGSESPVYVWGDRFIAEYVVFTDNSGHETANVGSRAGGVSWVGALDMSGNVSEWVADWYDPMYYLKSPRENPSGPMNGEYHVQRGSGWAGWRYTMRASHRTAGPTDTGNGWNGFRCARDN